MRVYSCLIGILALLVACQKIPPPPQEVGVPADEKKAHDKILSLGGEIGERNPDTGHITIVVLEGGEVNDKILGELVPLKKLEILELHDTTVTKRGIAKLKKLLPELEIIQIIKGTRAKNKKKKKK